MDVQKFRPITQAHYTSCHDKCPVPQTAVKSNGDSSNDVLINDEEWSNPAERRPLTFNCKKKNYNRKSYQPTCYGGFRAPIKAKMLNDMITGQGIIMQGGEVMKPRADFLGQQIQTNNNPYGAITAELFYRSSMMRTPGNQMKDLAGNVKAINLKNLQRCIFYEGAQPQSAATWQRTQVPRRITTTECGTILRRPKKVLPLVKEKNGKEDINSVYLRPYTGNLHTKTNCETVVEAHKTRVAHNRVGTAQVQQRVMIEKNQVKMMRVSTPRTCSEKRPDSRYNKATIYAKLEHGRGNSPEYQVPIIDMKLSEISTHAVMPSCWKQ